MSNQQTDRILTKLSKNGSIDVADLPHDLMRFYGECSAKEISLDQWNKIAISLYSHGEIEKYNAIMHYISSVEMDKSIHDTPQGRIQKRSINNTIIQVFLAKASKEENIEARSGYFQQAVQTLNVSKIKDIKSINFSIQGFMNFYQNKQISFTLKSLQNACLVEKTDIIDILGQGQVSFYAKDYAKALEFFKEALTKNPQLPGRARLGLAYCFFMQKKFELSKRAFQRVLDLDPTVLEAHLGLAVIAAQKQEWNDYVHNLNKAHEINSDNPLVLYYITEFYYIQQDFENTKKSGFKAINSLKSMPKILIDADKQKLYVKPHRIDFYDIKSRLYFMIGSCYHREKKLDLTHKFYEAALSANRGNIPANYGMAQILIQNRLEEIRTQSPENEKDITFEVYKPLAYLLSKQAMGQSKTLQQQYYQKALQYFPKDHEAQLEYANNLTDIEPVDSLKFFKAALAVLQEKKEVIHQEIYNNIGVLELHLKNYSAAKESFSKALEIASATAAAAAAASKTSSESTTTTTTDPNENSTNNNSTAMEEETKYTSSDAEESETKRISFLSTVKFNLGVLHEELHDLEAATCLYKEILQLCPYYLDAYVRLAHISLCKGNFQLAVRYCDEALQKKDEAHSSVVRIDLILCMKGYIQSQYEDDISARDSFYLIKKAGINDSYSKLYVSHMEYQQLIEKRDNYEFQKRIQFIGDRVKDILTNDPTNVQALMMLGIVLAENGQLAEAKEILNVLKENINVFPNIFFNLAQIAFLEKNFGEALVLYKKYSEKTQSGSNDMEYLMTQIALCQVHQEKFSDAKRTMKKLILRHPDSLLHRYNFFMVLHTEIEKVFSDQSKSLQEKEAAFIGCKRARDFLDFLKKDPKCKISRYADHFSSHVKQRRTDFYNTITEQCETKKFIFDSNIVSFEKMLNEARHKQNTQQQSASNYEDLVRKYKMKQELKLQREREEKQRAESQERRKKEERNKEKEILEQILKEEKEKIENDPDNPKKTSKKGQSKSKEVQKQNYYSDEGLDFLDDNNSNIDDNDSFNLDQQDDEMDENSKNDEVADLGLDDQGAGRDEKKHKDRDSSRKDKARKARRSGENGNSSNTNKKADEDEEDEDEVIFGGQNPAFQSSREPPLKKKKKLLRRNRKAADSQADYLDELEDDPAKIFSDGDGDAPAATQDNADDGEKVQPASTKPVKYRPIIDDDDDDVDDIFGDN